ncbi:MAG: hypothetical protein O3A09_03920 [Bacteroidetes bacterium]|nr:hypothetical protein [Bacteroidota bacterium]
MVRSEDRGYHFGYRFTTVLSTPLNPLRFRYPNGIGRWFLVGGHQSLE